MRRFILAAAPLEQNVHISGAPLLDLQPLSAEVVARELRGVGESSVRLATP
jgi:hypothetical protein